MMVIKFHKTDDYAFSMDGFCSLKFSVIFKNFLYANTFKNTQFVNFIKSDVIETMIVDYKSAL